MTNNSPDQGGLKATLGLRSVILFGLAYMTPIIVLGIFGVIAEASSGASAGAYLLASVAMLFTASSYARMSVLHPVAGSSYTYVRRSLDSRAGFLVGWVVLLDYLFLPLVIWLIGASYLNSQFPSVPSAIWVLVFVVITTILNIIGLKVADKANLVLMAMQVLVIAAFVMLAVLHLLGKGGPGSLIGSAPLTGSGGFSAVAAGAAIAAYSFLGFDAVSTLTEDTKDPQRTIPRAILAVAVIGGALFFVTSYVLSLVEPGASFTNADSLASDTARTIGGSLFASLFLAGLVIGQFTSGLAAQASVSRLMYAMGRDGALPQSFFGRLDARWATPVLNVVLTGVIGLGAIFLDVATSTSFINFGAFTAFTLVNIACISHFIRHRGQGLSFVWFVVVPAIGALVDLYLLTKLDGKALSLGFIWLAIGFAYLAFLTRGFTQKPPEMTNAHS
ncbi:MAG: APC family permease [Kocuria sp.]|nr:APC family permease [Kocuria sp.]